MKNLLKLMLLLMVTIGFYSCESDSTDDSEVETETETDPDTDPETDPDADPDTDTTAYLIKESLLNSDSLISFDIVESQLENGTTADCYRIVFSSNPTNIETGPYCPETDGDTAGMSFYDGATNPGLRVWEKALLDDIEADGYDIVDEDGTVHIEDFSGSTDSNPSTYSYCLDGLDDDSLQITFLIPVTPVLATTVNEIGEVVLVGLSLDGIPINGNPPSAINGPEQFGGDGTSTVVNIPSLDPCGGHNDPRGYYHWHMIPEVVNQVLVANDINQIECTNVVQTTDVILSGFAKDGYPIYAYAVEPDGLDACGGIDSATTEYPEGIYHYVASTMTAPNIPQCLVGVAARDAYTIN